MKRVVLVVITLSIHLLCSTQIISIGDGGTISTPYPYYYPNGWWSGIYDQAEINTSGDIYSLTVYSDILDDNWETYYNQKIFLGHTSEVEFNNYNLPDTASMTLAYSGSVQFYDESYVTITFNQPFNYNNSDNLIVYWQAEHGSYKKNVYLDATLATNKYLASYGHSFQDTAAGIKSNRPDIQLNFAKQYDVRPKEFVLPITDGDLSGNEIIRLYIENTGFDTITSFNLKYSIDSGSTWVTDNFSGTLYPFSSSLYTFSTLADMTAEKSYDVIVVTELGIDQVVSNDTLYTEITHLPKGAKCSDPILLTEPVTDLEGNTFETGNHYGYQSFYCAPNYVGENDAIYSFTLTEDTYISMRIDADRSVRASLHLLDGCPESTPTCLQWAGSSLPSAILGKSLTPGTYYVVVSSFPGINDWYYFWMDWNYTQVTDIESFDIGTNVSYDLDKENHTIDIVVPNGTNLTNLTPSFALPSGSSLYIGSDSITSGVTITDFTTPAIYTVKSLGEIFTQNWTITISADTNAAPSDLLLDNNHIAENQASDVVIGTLNAIDTTPGTYTYSLVAGIGDSDNTSFQIDGAFLKANAVFDYEVKDTFSIRAQVMENGVYTLQKAFEIIVDNSNENPVGLNLSNNSISELSPIGTTVGVFSTNDPEGGTYVYNLISGAGDTHNASFYVDGDSLKTSSLLDAETLTSMYVRVSTTDTGGLVYSTNFTITVSPENEAPTNISLSKSSLSENNSINTLVGLLSSSDPEGGSFLYSLVSGSGDNDNSAFSIAGTNLLAQEKFDKEIKDSFSIRIQTEDQTGLIFSKSFIITIDNINEAPDSIFLSSYSIVENTALYTEVGTINAHDPDEGETSFLFGFSSGSGDDDNNKFLILSGNKLVTNGSIDYEDTDTMKVRLRVYDSGFLIHYEQIKIIVSNSNESPVSINLSHNSVDENKAIGTGIAKLTATDPEGGDFTYSFANGTGDINNALFTIDGDSLRTNAIFDRETANSYQVRIAVTDTGGLSFENYFTITVNDVFENSAPYGINLNPGFVYENSAIGTGFGKLQTQDATPGTYSYELVSGIGDNDNNLFELEADSVRTRAVFDHETQSDYYIRIKTTEIGGDSFEKSFLVKVFNAFEAPDEIKISNDSIPETISQFGQVGSFFATGEDPYYSLDYELVSGDGDTDNDKFYSNAGFLYTNAVYDYETKNTFSIRIRAYNYSGYSFERIFMIYLVKENQSPMGLILSNEYIMENQSVGNVIGYFTTMDDDDETHTYTFVPGYDEIYFSLSENQLLSNTIFDYEAQSSYQIVVKTEDSAKDFFTKEFYIYIEDDGETNGMTEMEFGCSIIYPNPTINYSDLSINNNYFGKFAISIYDVSGKKILKTDFMKSENKMNIPLNMSEFSSGLYYLSVDYSNSSDKHKIYKY